MTEDANPTDVPPTDRLTALWHRLKDHRIAQWTVGYVAVAYGIQHAVTLTAEAYRWPDQVIRISMTLLALGLPLAMTLAWYHGERASRRMSAGELSIVSLLMLIASLLFYVFIRPAEIPATGAPAVQEASVSAARQASLSPATAISLAVMPFDNLSSDPDQGYFADGIGEEITTALARIPDLRVVGRESAQEFKGKHENFRNIGHALNATHLLEGSVRKAGNQLRISAELVRADTGATVWANAYDREPKDVFAVQEDIARSIAASLHMTLGLNPGENLVNGRTANLDSHEQYLRALSLLRKRGLSNAEQAVLVLEGAVAKDSGYASAWGLLSSAHEVVLLFSALDTMPLAEARQLVRDHVAKGEAAAQRALQLDPKSVEGLLALGELRAASGDRVSAMQLYRQALALEPDNPELLHIYSNELGDMGFVKQALPVRQHLLEIEPFVPAFQYVTARILFEDGQYDAALKVSTEGNVSAQVLAAQGRYNEAADALAKSVNLPRKEVEAASALLRSLPAALPPDHPAELGMLDWVYVYAKAPEQFLDVYEEGIRIGHQGIGATRNFEWAPPYSIVRKTERFEKYARDSGMVAYWRKNGWPDLCHPTSGDNFECS